MGCTPSSEVTESMAHERTNMLLAVVAVLAIAGGGIMVMSEDSDAFRQSFTIDGLTYTMTSGTEVSVGAEGFGISGHIVVPESVQHGGRTYQVTSVGDSGFQGCSGITGITLPESLKAIGTDAFSGCFGLTEIDVPDSVSSIGTEAFAWCYSMVDCLLPDSLEELEAYTFYGCASLETITIPAKVKNIGRQAFGFCSDLTDIWLLCDIDPQFYGTVWDFLRELFTGKTTTIHTFDPSNGLFEGMADDEDTSVIIEAISQMVFISQPAFDGGMHPHIIENKKE